MQIGILYADNSRYRDIIVVVVGGAVVVWRSRCSIVCSPTWQAFKYIHVCVRVCVYMDLPGP